MALRIFETLINRKRIFFVLVMFHISIHKGVTTATDTDKNSNNVNYEKIVKSAIVNNMDYGTLMDQWTLVKKEQKLIEALMNYTMEIQETISSLKTFISRYVENTVEPLKSSSFVKLGVSKEVELFDLDEFANNLAKDPFLTYQMLKRFSQDLPNLESQMKSHSQSEKQLRTFLVESKDDYKFPSSSDLESAMTSVSFLIMLYGLNLDDLSQGIIPGSDVNAAEFSAQDFYEFATFVEERQIYSLAINLLDKARTMLDPQLPASDFIESQNCLREKIEQRMESAIHQHNLYFTPNTTESTMQSQVFVFPEKIVKLEGSYNDRNITNFQRYKPKEGEFDMSQVSFELFPQLCRGEIVNLSSVTTSNDHYKNNLETSPLKCFHHVNHPYWILNPIKVEVLSKDPVILQYHQVATDTQIENIRKQMAVNLHRSRVISHEGANQVEDYRVSSSAVADDQDTIESWNLKVELITGLKATKIDDAEILQVTNYATGGHFLPHQDAFSHNDEIDNYLDDDVISAGDRIATFMYYLSPVQSGGRTAFPYLGLSAEPLTGSALFWYNLHPNGDVDERLLHGGCPILLGTKWIATKWIRSHNQMFLQKCSPNEKPQHTKDYWMYNSYGLEKPL